MCKIGLICCFLLWGFAFAQTQSLQVSPSSDVFEVRLPSNPTTGFQWVLKKYDMDQLEYLEKTYRSMTPHRIGGGGETIFLFHLKKKLEKTQLLFWSIRPWEKKPIEQRTVEVSPGADIMKTSN